jgi:response regulator of citrate/malate metabolism
MKKISIMLIDDNKIDLFIHKELINQHKIADSISEYMFASEALSFLKTNDLEKWPQLILLDIHMPIMNGFDFLEKFAEFPQLYKEKCAIIIVSSSLDLNDKMKSKDNPFVLELLEKPINIERLKKILVDGKILTI